MVPPSGVQYMPQSGNPNRLGTSPTGAPACLCYHGDVNGHGRRQGMVRPLDDVWERIAKEYPTRVLAHLVLGMKGTNCKQDGDPSTIYCD